MYSRTETRTTTSWIQPSPMVVSFIFSPPFSLKLLILKRCASSWKKGKWKASGVRQEVPPPAHPPLTEKLWPALWASQLVYWSHLSTWALMALRDLRGMTCFMPSIKNEQIKSLPSCQDVFIALTGAWVHSLHPIGQKRKNHTGE